MHALCSIHMAGCATCMGWACCAPPAHIFIVRNCLPVDPLPADNRTPDSTRAVPVDGKSFKRLLAAVLVDGQDVLARVESGDSLTVAGGEVLVHFPASKHTNDAQGTDGEQGWKCCTEPARAGACMWGVCGAIRRPGSCGPLAMHGCLDGAALAPPTQHPRRPGPTDARALWTTAHVLRKHTGPVMIVKTPDMRFTVFLESEDTWHLDFSTAVLGGNSIKRMHGLLG